MKKFLTGTNIPRLHPKELVELYYNQVLLNSPTHFCEIGAREASASLFIGKNLPECNIYAYEANPYVYNKFKDNIYKQNNKINYKNLAISNKIDSVNFYIQNNKPKDIGNNSLLKRNRNSSYEKLTIKCNTLDSTIYNRQFSYCLWIDAEGCGYEVLLGAKNILYNTKVIFIEVESISFWKNQKLDNDIYLFLTDNNFKLLAYDNQYYDLQYNMIFIK